LYISQRNCLNKSKEKLKEAKSYPIFSQINSVKYNRKIGIRGTLDEILEMTSSFADELVKIIIKIEKI
jgi:hypothetical protein